jgi:diguanylate cyclase (GGDEF)-like protein
MDPGTVLVVDDRESNRLLLQEMLEGAGHRAIVARDGLEAIEMAASGKPDVILLDVNMSGMDGFEVCAKLQSLAETASIPVIFITANYTEEEDVLHGLEIGAYDYLVKPVSRTLLLARVGVMLKIHRSEQRIRELSMVDEFTGLFTKNYVLRRLEEEMKRADRQHSTLAVSMLDIDDFKRLNDTFGHQFGDDVLKRVAATLKQNVRLYDSVGRYGGEEFLLLLPDLVESGAVALIERLHEKVAEERFYEDGQELGIGFSAGLAVWDQKVSAEEIVRQADCALYSAKRAGKNQTVRYSEMPAESAGGPDSHHRVEPIHRL